MIFKCNLNSFCVVQFPVLVLDWNLGVRLLNSHLLSRESLSTNLRQVSLSKLHVRLVRGRHVDKLHNYPYSRPAASPPTQQFQHMTIEDANVRKSTQRPQRKYGVANLVGYCWCMVFCVLFYIAVYLQCISALVQLPVTPQPKSPRQPSGWPRTRPSPNRLPLLRRPCMWAGPNNNQHVSTLILLVFLI